MGTRSRIGYQLEDGSIVSTYCHWDGYPSGVGQALLDNYDDRAAAEALVNIGYISSVEETIEETAAGAANKGNTEVSATPDEFFKLTKDSWGEWAYYMQTDGMWLVSAVRQRANWHPLETTGRDA